MRYTQVFRVASLAAIVLASILAPLARAQNPVRVVRLSRAEGQVLVAHAGSDAWEEAPANLPLQEGDTLATQGGLAEIEFENGATAFLAENSTLQFTQVGFSGAGRATELTLTEGAAAFYANLTSQDTFRVRTSTFDVAIPERAQFRVDAFSDGAAVQVLLGSVSISTAKGSTDLEKGQSVAIHEKDFQDLNIIRVPQQDDFDRWVTEEGEIIRSGNKNTLSYISSPNYYGLSDLSIYGSWINLPGLGISWRPFSTGLNWTPYLNGVWQLNPLLGWVWVSNEAWGWMPYHFGSWELAPTIGWIWVPGGPTGLQQWQPARVNWVNLGGPGSSRVGWVAMSPNDHEGSPANIAQGVIAKSLESPLHRAALDGSSLNEMVTGKALQNVTAMKQPSPELASRAAVLGSGPGVAGAPHPGVRSTIRIAPWTLNNNPSIVYDHRTRTYVNREPSLGLGEAVTESSVPAAPRVPTVPGSVVLRRQPPTQPPQGSLPFSAPTDSRGKRVLLPPIFPTTPVPRANFPANAIPPVRITPSTPRHSGVPPASATTTAPGQSRGALGNAANSPASRPANVPTTPPQLPAKKDQR